jgi:predicted ferric reductase
LFSPIFNPCLELTPVPHTPAQMTDALRGTPPTDDAPRHRRRRPGWKLLDTDVVAALTAFTLCIGAIWARHGGVRELRAGHVLMWTSLTDLTGLAASALGLVGFVLVARPRFFERTYGLDRTFVWHRQIGAAMTVLVGVHVAVAMAATVPERGVISATRDLTGRLPYMALATVGTGLIAVVTITSLRAVRRRFAYETWYFLHLLAYAGFALAFGHEIALGSDLSTDAVARWFWVLIHVAVLAALLWGRWLRSILAARRPLHVSALERPLPGMVAITLSGPAVNDLEAVAGQFFLLRPLHRDLWWQTHPFSLSAAPTDGKLRFTVKDRGDASGSLATLRRGAPVALEGPFGVCTPDVFEGRRALFVAGGIGIAPVRAVLETLGPDAAPVVLYRAHHEQDLVHLKELEDLAVARGGQVLTLVGPSARFAAHDPFGAATLRRAVPDLDERVAVVCGPERLLHAARAGLRAAGVPSERIHFERPWW